MFSRLTGFMSSIWGALISGVFLVISFVLSKINIDPIIDPAWVSVVMSGIPLLVLAARRVVVNKGISKISSALLITVAMVAAIVIGDLFAAGEVAFIMAIGEILEDMTTDRAKKGLKKLMSIAPATARIVVNGKEEVISAEKIQKDDILRILPGETIPADGKIIFGDSSVDQSVITGESLPIDKTIGDEVFCGTLNCFGSIDIKATSVGSDSSLQKLIRLVKDAEKNKAPMARAADKWASFLVPAALLIAIITGIVTRDIVRAVTILVVFCPCALVLATPTAIMAAIGQATKHGVIIKSGEALEKMGQVDTIAFDKTGTLTEGKLTVCDVFCVNSEYSEDELLKISAGAESRSEHPVAKALIKFANDSEIDIPECSEFFMYAGKGISATVDGCRIMCGNESFMKEKNVELPENACKKLVEFYEQGKAVIIVAHDSRCIGIISLTDVLRDESKTVIESLETMHTNSVLLTGDSKKAASYIVNRVGIKEYYSELLPAQKVERIQQLKKEKKIVCMIGDGINDAPALKSADVGVAMARVGSDIAVESADIALMGDDISKLPYLKRLSNATVNTIKFSIALSMVINFAAVVLSVLGVLNPTTGALVHNAGSVFVVLIAALLYDRKFDKHL